MAENQHRIAVIVGSVRAGRFGPVAADWLLSRLALRDDFKTDVLDLAEFNLPGDLSGGEEAEAFTKRIDAADGFVLVTPEYNHGYPGALKTAIDTAREEWRAKPLGFVSYGGMAGGLRSVEQLRLVLTELQVVTLRECVSFTWVEDQFDERGTLIDPRRANSAAQTMLDQLAWWTGALRRARLGGADHD